MLTYRNYIYRLAMEASADAVALSLSLSHSIAERGNSDYRTRVKEEMPRFQTGANRLQVSVDKLLGALPSEVREAVRNGNLHRHLKFIDYYLGNGAPQACAQDPVDVAKHDLPGVLRLFDAWYEHNSLQHVALSDRLAPLVATGQLNSAIREAWVMFKSRMVSIFGLSDNLDGHKLVNQLFGKNGAASDILSQGEQQGYSNLLKGLYTLSRNPVSHNDVVPNPEEIDAVLALVNSVLAMPALSCSQLEQLKVERTEAN